MKKFKMPSAFTISFYIIIAVAILTWIIPSGAYNYIDPNASKLQPIGGTYHSVASNFQGLWEVINAPIKGFKDAVSIELFVLVIGGFLAVITKTGAIDAGVSNALVKFKGKEHKIIPILMILFAIGGTTFGMCEESLPFYPMLIPIFIAAGYDVIVPVSIIMLGAGIGCLGSTVNPFSIGIASGFAEISIADGLLLRIVILVVTLFICIIFVMRYAEKVKKDPSKSIAYDMKEDNEKFFLSGKTDEKIELTPKRKKVLIVFSLAFITMVVGVIPWGSKFGIKIFENFNKFITSIPILGRIVGKPVVLGDWGFGEMALVFLVFSVIAAMIYKFSEDEFITTFVDGARSLLGVALIIGVCRGITVVMNDGNMTATVLHVGEEGLKNLSPVGFTNLAFLFYIPLSFLVPSTTGLATLSMPIMAPLAQFAHVNTHIVITAFATASGIVNLITPTSAVVMSIVLLSRISYVKLMKFIWKLVLLISVVCMVIMSIASIL